MISLSAALSVTRGVRVDLQLVVDNEDVAHTRKSIGFDISEAGVGVAIYVARQMRLLARASTPAKGDALAALEIAKDFLGERHVRSSSFGGKSR
jgi:hypothetical protein